MGGFHTEYSSIRFALFFLAEFMNTVTISAMVVTLFLGGPNGPAIGFLPEPVADRVVLRSSCSCFLFIYVWLRATLPRFRYDQLMDLGWKKLIPASLFWLLLVAALRIGRARGLEPGLRPRRRAWPWARWAGGRWAPPSPWARWTTPTCPGRPRRSVTGGREPVMGYLDGFKVTLKTMFEDRVTNEYPDEKRPKPDRFHGRHVLNRYEDGMEKCIGCELCAGVCPARCIYVRGADNPPDAPVSPGERFGFVYEINYLRCIHCDLCVEACPTEAITESKLFEFSFTNRQDAIYTRAELLVDDDGLPQKLPWEDWREGDEVNTSAWVRATAPSRRAPSSRARWRGRASSAAASVPPRRARRPTRQADRPSKKVARKRRGPSERDADDRR